MKIVKALWENEDIKMEYVKEVLRIDKNALYKEK